MVTNLCCWLKTELSFPPSHQSEDDSSRWAETIFNKRLLSSVFAVDFNELLQGSNMNNVYFILFQSQQNGFCLLDEAELWCDGLAGNEKGLRRDSRTPPSRQQNRFQRLLRWTLRQEEKKTARTSSLITAHLRTYRVAESIVSDEKNWKNVAKQTSKCEHITKLRVWNVYHCENDKLVWGDQRHNMKIVISSPSPRHPQRQFTDWIWWQLN